ncbi:MAG: M23 family metallopeptidase [Elainellaceae cyanobacterium]
MIALLNPQITSTSLRQSWIVSIKALLDLKNFFPSAPASLSVPKLAIALIASMAALSSPAKALEVQILPDDPQLGDTLSIRVQTETPGGEPPVVVMNQQNYPTFPLGGNQYRALLPTTPLDRAGRVEIDVMGDEDVRHLAVWLRDRAFPTQRIWLPPDRAGLEGTDFEFDRVAEFKTLVTPDRFWAGSFLRPAGGRVSTIYGVRRYYNGEFAHDYYHRGVDYAGGQGSPVVAPAAGRIGLVGLESQGFRIHGNTIGIDHGQGVLSIFLHLSRIDVREGDMVRAGQVIGAIGSTGISTGPHLHWGLYVHGMAVDPVPWRYDGIE